MSVAPDEPSKSERRKAGEMIEGSSARRGQRIHTGTFLMHLFSYVDAPLIQAQRRPVKTMVIRGEICGWKGRKKKKKIKKREIRGEGTDIILCSRCSLLVHQAGEEYKAGKKKVRVEANRLSVRTLTFAFEHRVCIPPSPCV